MLQNCLPYDGSDRNIVESFDFTFGHVAISSRRGIPDAFGRKIFLL